MERGDMQIGAVGVLDTSTSVSATTRAATSGPSGGCARAASCRAGGRGLSGPNGISPRSPLDFVGILAGYCVVQATDWNSSPIEQATRWPPISRPLVPRFRAAWSAVLFRRSVVQQTFSANRSIRD